MPAQSRNWYFEPGPFNDDDGGETGDDSREDDPLIGVSAWSPEVLQRHGARVLDPGSAEDVYESREPGSAGHRARKPRPTAYRARTLLIPASLAQSPDIEAAINHVLGGVGMRIVVPEERREFRSRAADDLRQLPRPVVLEPAAPEPGKLALPVVVDAWVALQALRAAADAAQDDAVLSRDVVGQIRLEHLLVGWSIIGEPSSGGHPLTGPGVADSYVCGSGDTRAPVAVCLDAPARRPLEECGSRRRSVVAVLDTGVRAHPWLDVAPDPDPAVRYVTVPDGFVAVDKNMQATIYLEDQSAPQSDQPRQLIKDPWDRPVTANPLVGELDEATGHGSFIAGIVRQVAPDAQVLAIRVMHSDDVVYESTLINALALIADRVAFAQAGHMEDMVDVVSLSLGYYDESPADALYTSGLWLVIERLLGMGVAIFASAGNSATSQMCFPAAFAVSSAPGPVRLISVGALNPNGTKALFSNDGQWVRAWADGAEVVSTFPVDINGSYMPPVKVPARPRQGKRPVDREALDPDDFSCGFATWSGTSFSAPLLAGVLAAQLLENAVDESGPALDEPGVDAARMRVEAALSAVRDRGADRDG
ncbi:MAG TPA: S8/S53 family peptidase [Trebonia sp.]|jgi:hypothetical protein